MSYGLLLQMTIVNGDRELVGLMLQRQEDVNIGRQILLFRGSHFPHKH